MDATKRQLPTPSIDWERTEDWDWPEHIKKLMVPSDIGKCMSIVPHWEKPDDSARIPIRLDGRFGFGVGALHPTTRLCLETLERRLDGAIRGSVSRFADIGCGSGILSIAAILLGVDHVYAVDTKAAAVFGTLRNRELNEVDPNRLVVEQGSVSDVQHLLTGSVDGFVCNILTRIIVHLIPSFKDISGPNTWGILSGIRDSELSYLEGPLERNGWTTTGVTRDEGWCCLEICRA